jgi:hypothetical protein
MHELYCKLETLRRKKQFIRTNRTLIPAAWREPGCRGPAVLREPTVGLQEELAAPGCRGLAAWREPPSVVKPTAWRESSLMALCGGWGPLTAVHNGTVEDGGGRPRRWRPRRVVTSGEGGRGGEGYPSGDGGRAQRAWPRWSRTTGAHVGLTEAEEGRRHRASA